MSTWVNIKADMTTCAKCCKERLLQAGADEILKRKDTDLFMQEKNNQSGKSRLFFEVYGHYRRAALRPLDLWHSGPFEPIIK